MRLLVRIALLVALWLLAWGEFTLANLVSGVVVASAVAVAFPLGRRGRVRVRLRFGLAGVVRLAAYMASQLLVSNVLMARQILSRRPDASPGVIAHRLRRPSEEAVTVMTSIIALSPGMMTVDVDPQSTTIYVHFFRLRDVDAARRGLERLERLVFAAIASPYKIRIAMGNREEAP